MDRLPQAPLAFLLTVACAGGGGASATDSAATTSSQTTAAEPTTAESTSTSTTEGETTEGTAESETASSPTCGDGNVDADEACDDGNVENGDGCAADCTIEPHPTCPGWERVYALPNGNNSPAALALDSAGRMIIVGSDLAPANSRFILALSPTGEALWSATGTDVSVIGNAAVALADDDSIYVGGYFEGTHIERMSVDGAHEWFGPGDSSAIADLTYKGGAIFSSGHWPGDSCRVRRHDPGDGAILWKSLDPDTSCHGITIGDGEVVVVGRRHSGDSPLGPNYARFSFDGDPIEEVIVALDEFGWGEWLDVAAAGDGGLFLAGWSGNPREPAWAVARVDAAGEVLWSHVEVPDPGDSGLTARTIVALPDGGAVALGSRLRRYDVNGALLLDELEEGSALAVDGDCAILAKSNADGVHVRVLPIT